MSHRFLAFAALGVVASAIVPSASQAQLGKLTKKATDAAGNAAGVPNSNARYVKKIDLTSAQLIQVNKGLAQSVKVGPETIKKWEKQQADYDKAYAAYTKNKEKHDQCVESEKEKARGKVEAANNKANAAGERMGKSVDTASMMAQAQAAQAAAERVNNGTATAADRQTLADFQKTMAGVSAGSNATAAAMQESMTLQQAVVDSINKKCGAEPQPPAPGGGAAGGGGAGGAAGGAQPTSAAEDINKQGAEAAGMSDAEFRLAKEKAMGYAASNTQVQGGGGTSDDEAKAINDALGQTRDLMAQANKANVPLM